MNFKIHPKLTRSKKFRMSASRVQFTRFFWMPTEWRVTEYQPERKEPPPDLKAVNAPHPEEWEE
jgi:hypothetical protein